MAYTLLSQTYTTKGTVRKRWLGELASNSSFNLSMYASKHGLSAEVSKSVLCLVHYCRMIKYLLDAVFGHFICLLPK